MLPEHLREKIAKLPPETGEYDVAVAEAILVIDRLEESV